MFRRGARITGAALLAAVPAVTLAVGAEPPSFERDVRPILKAYCLDCHGAAAKPKGGLDLRLARFAQRGGESGPAVVAGRPDESLLVERLSAGEMPPGEKKVPPAMIKTIEAWVAAGCRTARDEPESLPVGIDITPEDRAYWFFQPLRRPAAPALAGADRVRTPIDAFVLAKLRDRGLDFNPDADGTTLLRRASLDLTGLPPTMDEVDRFLADASPDAYERAVDRLLASPRYGERWGRHWLDVAGYADSDGDGVTDTPRPHAWRYRDYVVMSLNVDKPFDRFVVEQLAGDELVPPPRKDLTADQIGLLVATGFLRTAPDPTSSGGGDAESNQVVADTIKIVSATFLGLSVGCAQCHDHRYDPISQVDYFRLRAVFEPALDPTHWRRPAQRLMSLYTEADRAKAAKIADEATVISKEYQEKTTAYVRAAFLAELEKFPADSREELRVAFDTPEAKRDARQKMLVASNPKLNITPGNLYQYNMKASDELKAISGRVAAKAAQKPAEGFVAIADETPGVVPVTKRFHRGDHRQPKEEIGPGDLTIAAPAGSRFDIAASAGGLPTSGRRLAYARHLTSGSHPLVGRVLANRLWLGHFGQGIVETPGEFGKLGRLPSHPELLDWLAAELPAQGWSLKAMHRLIMRSTVYRQASRREPARDRIDSSNALLGRYPVHRLEAEAIRDRLLWVAGTLDSRMGGPPVAATLDTVGQVVTPADAPRRSVYLQQRRTQPVAFLAAFDGPGGELNCDRRQASTSAPQALMLMNSDFLLRCAEDFARRLRTAPEMQERITLAWRLAYQRNPSPQERAFVAAFWKTRRDQLARDPKADADLGAWSDVCQQLLSSNEVLYVD